MCRHSCVAGSQRLNWRMATPSRVLQFCFVWCSAMAHISAQQISHFEYGPPSLCGADFTDFNASGVYTINPHVVQPAQSGQPDNLSGLTANSSWAVTIQNSYGAANSDSELSTSFGAWYNPNGADYRDDLGLGYDVCAIAIGFPDASAIYQGQHDDGTCSSTFDEPCIAALKAATTTYASWLVGGNHGTQTNLTSTSLPGICGDIATMMNGEVPKECLAYFQDFEVIGGALTTFKDDYPIQLNDSCQINGTFENVLNFSTNSSLPVYTNETQLIVPVMTVFMPVANPALTVTISQTVSELSCLRVNTINPGSYTPPAMADPDPASSNTSKGLSGGAIAGIVIGVLLALALIGGIAFWLWRRQRMSKRGGGIAGRPASHADAKELLGANVVEAPHGTERYELHGGASKQYEMETTGSKQVNELSGTTRYELA